MRKMIFAALAALALLLVGSVPSQATETDTDGSSLSQSADTSVCGQVTLSGTNETAYIFAVLWTSETATADGVTTGTFRVPGELTLAFDEDANGGSAWISYGISLGAESDWYLAHETVTVDTDCVEPEPTEDPDPTVDPTEDPTSEPTVDPTSEPTTDPTVTPSPDPTVNPEPSACDAYEGSEAWCDPGVEDYNCSDVAAYAPITLLDPDNDPFALDGNGDGFGCEALATPTPTPSQSDEPPSPTTAPHDGNGDEELPDTGSSSTLAVLLGLGLLGAGSLMLLRRGAQ